jgi:ribonuclease R
LSAEAGFVAVLEQRGRALIARPLFGRARGEDRAAGFARGSLTIDPRMRAARGDRRPKAGDLVLVSLTPTSSRGRGRDRGPGIARARVERVLGRPDVARDVIEALMLERGLRRRFDPAVEREARAARDAGRAAEGSAASDPGRRDLRDLVTFTIDPVGARDFDDAISAQALDDGIRIWVHIADVAAFVPAGSLVDREAQRRTTSVYVPGAVEPMLPEPLSNDACSLVPGRDRLAVTVELDLDGPRVTRASFFRSVIRSDERLDYDRVDRIFAGQEPALAPWAEPLAVARTAAAQLGREREQRAALEIVSGEPEFGFDDSGHVAELREAPQTESHKLIEHLMITANEQVATLLDTRGIPTLYRVHERPDPARVERLVAQLASLGVATPPLPEKMSPSQAAELVGEISQLVSRHVRRTGHGSRAFTSLVLRSLKQAYYSPRNLGHAGLGSPRYCHFTSPIRRYPDLVCHRGLLSAIGAGEIATRSSGLEQLGEWTSLRERDAMTIERDADDVARSFALGGELQRRGWDAPFAGEVVGLIGAGAFVSFGAPDAPMLFEGMLPVRRMGGDDWWELNELGTVLHGTRSGATLRLGDPLRVRVRSIDAPRGRVDLEAV